MLIKWTINPVSIKRVSINKAVLSIIAVAAITAPIFSMTAQGAGLQLMPGSANFGTAGAGHAAIGLGAGSAWANPCHHDFA